MNRANTIKWHFFYTYDLCFFYIGLLLRRVLPKQKGKFGKDSSFGDLFGSLFNDLGNSGGSYDSYSSYGGFESFGGYNDWL